MKFAAAIPTPPEIVRETLIVVAGALLAAWLMSNWPAGRQYIKDAWASPQQQP